MGIYYKVVCPSRSECIEPCEIGDEVNADSGGIKKGPFVLNHTMQIAACFAIDGPWAGEAMVVCSDGGLRDDLDDADFKNVTKEALALFREQFPKYADEWKLHHVPLDDDMAILDEHGRALTLPDQKTCDHGVTFDKDAAQGILSAPDPHKCADAAVAFVMGHSGSAEIRKRWPRGWFTAERPCPKGCGYIGIAYASYEHYVLGDW